MWRTKLCTEEAGHDLSGRAVWEFRDPLVCRSEKYGDLLIPPRFRTNYVSVPRWPFIFLLAGDRAHKPAALHDLAYTLHALLQVQFDDASGTYTAPKVLPIDRAQADDLLLEALLAEPLITEGLAQTMHRAVSWFGAASWSDTTNVLQDESIRQLYQPLLGDLL